MGKKTIKMKFLDWYEEEDNPQNFYAHSLIKKLQKRFNIVYSDKPDFIIYSQDGFSHLKYDCVRIFYTGENIRADFNRADYAIDFDYMDFGDRHFRHDLFDLQGAKASRPISDKDIESKKKFCCVLMSNSNSCTKFREIFFDKLNEYKKVDSGGRYKNNIGYRIGEGEKYFSDSKIAWLKGYKFNICFENSSYPGYLTEKLSDAFIAGCVPIYWGDTSLRVGLDSIESSRDEGGGGK